MNNPEALYQTDLLSHVSTIPWLRDLQEQALADFKQQGFPTRADEDWKYSAPKHFLNDVFLLPKAPIRSVSTHETPLADVIACHIDNADIAIGKLPQGLTVIPITTALTSHASLIQPYLGQILRGQHAFHHLNLASPFVGFLIHVARGIKVDVPLWLSHSQSIASQMTPIRHLILLEQDSALTIIQDFNGDDDVPYFTNMVTEVQLNQDAHLTHYTLQREGRKAYHVDHIGVNQDKNSQFHHHALSLGGAWVRGDISVQLTAPGAEVTLNGLYLPGHNQHIDHHTDVHHVAPNCRSDETYRGVLSAGGRAVFNGKVVVEKGANGTSALQQNKNLLLSENTEIDTKPQLEIFADDVTCSHGATVGQLDEDAIFYMATRGIPRDEAILMLIQAFSAEILQRAPHEALVKLMSKWRDDHLRKEAI